MKKKKKTPKKKPLAKIKMPVGSQNGKPPAKSSGRKAGRPKRGEEPIKQEDYAEIEMLWGTGMSINKLAKKYGISFNSMQVFMRNHIFTAIKLSSARTLEAELCKIATLEAVAWERFFAESPSETREQIKEELGKCNQCSYASKELVEKVSVIIKKPGQKAWLEVVQWCIEQRCKMSGHYAPKKIKVDHEEFRVAGMSPSQVNAGMLKRLMGKIEDRREYERSLKGSGVVLGPSIRPSDN